MKSNLIGAIIKSSRMKSDFTHNDDNDEEEDTEVVGMIIEMVEDDTSGTSYLVMDENGLVYQTEFNDIDRIISFGGNPTLYLKKQKNVL